MLQSLSRRCVDVLTQRTEAVYIYIPALVQMGACAEAYSNSRRSVE